MPKSIKFVNLLALWVFCIFTFAMFATYFSEYLSKIDFFADKACTHTGHWGNAYQAGDVDWGAKHYWYYWMCLILFILSAIRVFVWADWYWSDKDKS